MNGELRIGLSARIVAFALSLLFAATAASADTVVRLKVYGSSANRIDIVILGDGYRTAELPKFATDANDFLNAFVAEPPLNLYKRDFNVRRIDRASALSGAGTAPGRNTAYGSYFFCDGFTDRLLCADNAKVNAVLTRDIPANQRDIVVVLVNDVRYGGSGGPIAVASTHPQAKEIALHELGHSFGHLDDEYDYGGCTRTDAWGFNVTTKTVRAQIPWTKWIPAATPVPTPTDRGPGLYSGAFYCTAGWYRPTFDSKMRTLGVPFKQVNSEQLIRRIYEFVNMIDRVAPATATVKIAPGGSQVFTVTPIDATSKTLRFAWRLGGVLISSTKTATVTYADVATAKTLQLAVADATSRIRTDPANVHIDRRNWKVSR